MTVTTPELGVIQVEEQRMTIEVVVDDKALHISQLLQGQRRGSERPTRHLTYHFLRVCTPLPPIMV